METLLFFTLIAIMISGGVSSKNEDVNKNANNYDSTKLLQNIGIMKSFIGSSGSDFPAHKITKRSTNRNKGPRADDLILNSLASYCKNFLSNPDISKYMDTIADNQPLSKQDMNSFTRYILEHVRTSGAWDQGPFPVKVSAEEEDSKIWIVFHVAHSEAVKVSNLNYDDFQEVILDVPDSVCNKIVSKARFSIPSQRCTMESYRYQYLEHFRVNSGTGNQAVNVYMNICRWLRSSNDQIITKKFIDAPFFRLIPPSPESNTYEKSVVFLNDPNAVTSFEVDVPVSYKIILMINMILWNSESKEIFQSTAELQWIHSCCRGSPDIKYKTQSQSGDGEHLFNTTISHPKDDGPVYSYNYRNEGRVRLRINVKPMPIHGLSGQISFVEKTPSYFNPIYIRHALEVTVPLVRQAGPKWNVPLDLIYFTGNSAFLCLEDGNLRSMFHGAGKNCVIQCQAYGVELAFIYITKRIASKRREEFTLKSYVVPNVASAVLNVGLADEDVEGEYECNVINKQGYSKTQKLMLHINLQTIIKTLTVETTNTEKANITCDAQGFNIKEVFVSVCDNDIGRCRPLDLIDKSKFDTKIQEYENGKILSVSTDWAELAYPVVKLSCEASGESGKAIRHINLRDHDQK